MYQKPDFVKVEINIRDNFSNYGLECDAFTTTALDMEVNTTTHGCNNPIYVNIIQERYNGGVQCYSVLNQIS